MNIDMSKNETTIEGYHAKKTTLRNKGVMLNREIKGKECAIYKKLFLIYSQNYSLAWTISEKVKIALLPILRVM